MPDGFLEALTAAKAALDSIGVEWFLSDGTLLGYVRNGDFIEHDHDIDIGVFIDSYNDLIPSACVSHGFIHTRTIGYLSTGYELTFQLGDVPVDVFFYYSTFGEEPRERVWHAVWQGGIRRRYMYTPFGLQAVEFRGLEVLVPTNAERVVEEQYGPGWRKPITAGWSWWESPHNIVEG